VRLQLLISLTKTNLRFREILILFLLLLIGIKSASSQNMPGFNTGNYSGVTGIDLQPANIADNRYKIDLCLLGYGTNFSNNFIGFKSKALTGSQIINPTGDVQKDYLKSYIGQNEFNRLNLDMYLQSFSVLISMDKGRGFAFTFKLRGQLNIENFTNPLANILYNSNKLPEYWKIVLNNDQAAINSMLWADIGLGYGQPIYDKGRHFIKVGGKLKFMPGIDAGYLFAKNLNYKFKNRDSLDLFSTKFGYGHSDNYEINYNLIKVNRFSTIPGLGFDAGVVYEYREADINKTDDQENKYKFKLGFSLIDFGYITFNKSPNSRDFDASVSGWDISNIKLSGNKTPIQNLDDTLNRRFVNKSGKGSFTMVLPAGVSLQGDYHIHQGFYAAFVANVHPNLGNEEHRLSGLDYYTIVPRWESKRFGVFLPQSMNGYGIVNSGIALRMGPVAIGSSDIFNLWLSNYVRSIDVNVSIKISFLKKKPKGKTAQFYNPNLVPTGPKTVKKKDKRDSDGDGVPNEIDKCPNQYGSPSAFGCPDLDGDSVTDNLDLCPATPGVPSLGGCPDLDKDRIIDQNDSCKDVPGEISLNGCPDKDKDGVADYLDKCPDMAGPPESNGCPDTDHDGVPDNLDKCPQLAGSPSTKGCPDSDGDGIMDYLDKCPDKPGTLKMEGCPDTDKDGIPDHLDLCPELAGTKLMKGCPGGDEDKDGVPDQVDQCPKEKGSIDLNGCPGKDSDFDGIADESDLCPFTPGLPTRKGCPNATKDLVNQTELINKLDNLFEEDKFYLEPSQLPLIDAWVKLAIKELDRVYRVQATYIKGSPQAQLVKDRAYTLKKYIVSKGLGFHFISTEVKEVDPTKGTRVLPEDGRVIIRILNK